MVRDDICSFMIFSVMENQNYFEKFVRDLEEREQNLVEKSRELELAREMWEKRQSLDRSYREHTHQRIRYGK